jgi:mannose/cellobiose epimerase-like protein (N-acyl-D-glucosamine 2-epimerase family)
VSTPGSLSAPQPPQPDAAALAAEAERLFSFAEAAALPTGGFGMLGRDGALDPGQAVHTWVTGRMVHVFSLASLLGRAGATDLVDTGLAALTRGGVLHDDAHGGWYAAVDRSGIDGAGTDTSKVAYATAFVVLAASSATVIGRPGAPDLLAEALDVVDRRFWDPGHGLVADEWDRTWTRQDPYRGVNANMHTVEALLSAADATGNAEWRHRAGRIVERVVHGFAQQAGWRLPEHYDLDWRPLPDYNTDERAHPFRPYGVTPGHLLEWARLCLHLRAALERDAAAGRGQGAPQWVLPSAQALFDTAVADGWAADGSDGFVYTTDFDGSPVVTARMHWVLTEAIGAASALYQVTGEQRYADRYAQWWAHARERFIDLEGGNWHHELDPQGNPSFGTWAGKPDVYHAVQATLVPRLPLAPMVSAALREATAT